MRNVTSVITSGHCRCAGSGTQQEAALMGLPAGRNTCVMQGRVPGSVASPRDTGALSIVEQGARRPGAGGPGQGSAGPWLGGTLGKGIVVTLY